MRANQRHPSLTLVIGVAIVVGGIVTLRAPLATAQAVANITRSVQVDGAYLRDVVVDATDHAYASNSNQDRVEVLDLTSGELQAPIAAGDAPAGLSLSADSKILYVINSGSHDISVIDLTLRQETKRVPLPSTDGTPFQIAVANNGKAFVDGFGYGGSSQWEVMKIDLNTGASSVVPTRNVSDPVAIAASGDGSRVVLYVSDTYSTLLVYEAATDSFVASRQWTGVFRDLAVDSSGSTIMLPGTLVFGGDLSLRATLSGDGTLAVALNPSGSTGYRLKADRLELIDISRGLVTLSTPASDADALALAVAPDGRLAASVGPHQFDVLPMTSATPVPCPAPSVPFYVTVVPICGAPLADVVVDNRGRAYASNPQRNEVEVLSLVTRHLGTPILVGSQPNDMALSPDGNTLYVVDSGSEEISIVDLNSAVEIGRLRVPPGSAADRPLSIGIANNGTALLTTADESKRYGDRRFLQVNLSTGEFSPHSYPESDEYTSPPKYVAASGDGSIILVYGNGPEAQYRPDTDSFVNLRSLGIVNAALDRNGDATIATYGAGTAVATAIFDRNMVRRGTVAVGDYPLAIDAAGTTGYVSDPGAVTPINLRRATLIGNVALGDADLSGVHPQAVAVTADGSTIVAATHSGLTVASTASVRTFDCVLPVPNSPAVIPMCGGGEAVVIDKTNTAFVTDGYHNEVDAVSLSSHSIVAKIPVGSQPSGLDLSPDGASLYVADHGADEISIVDVAGRRETSRITVPPDEYDLRPTSIAVGNNGKVLVTMTSTPTYSGRLVELDLTDYTSHVRSDVPVIGGWIWGSTILKASGDRTKIAISAADSVPGLTFVFSPDTDSFGPMKSVPTGSSDLAVDKSGSRYLFGRGSFVTDGDLQLQGTIPPDGYGVAVSADGQTGYRVGDGSVDVLDLNARTVVRSIPLPDPIQSASALVALSPDEMTLVVTTLNGLSILPVNPTPAAPVTYTVWSQASAAPLTGLGSWLYPVDDPVATGSQRPPMYLVSQGFNFAGRPAASGMVGFGVAGAAKFAAFWIVDPDGTPHTASVPYAWSAGHLYLPLVYELAPGTWGAWMLDYSGGPSVFIGQLNAPAQWGLLSPASVTTVTWFGELVGTCSDFPYLDVLVSRPVGYIGTAATSATSATTDQTPSTCPSTTSDLAGGWVRYQYG